METRGVEERRDCLGTIPIESERTKDNSSHREFHDQSLSDGWSGTVGSGDFRDFIEIAATHSIDESTHDNPQLSEEELSESGKIPIAIPLKLRRDDSGRVPSERAELEPGSLVWRSCSTSFFGSPGRSPERTLKISRFNCSEIPSSLSMQSLPIQSVFDLRTQFRFSCETQHSVRPQRQRVKL